LNIISPFRIFEQLALALKIFSVLNTFFTIQDFWATCACPEKQFALKILTVLNILFSFRIFEQLALALKNRVCSEFTV